MWRARPASCTRRIDSSRWIWRGAGRPGNSALVGARAIVADRQIRMHRFRAEAQRAVAAMDPAWRAIIEAYTSGVNSGLSQLRKPPFEYVLLRQEPHKWLVEDSAPRCAVHVHHAQDPDGA